MRAWSLLTTAPPNTVEIVLSLPKLRMVISPNDPIFFPLYVAPRACAQSSMRMRLCSFAIFWISSTSAGMPNVCWMIIAFVFSVIFFLMSLGSMLYVPFLISAYIGFAPRHIIGAGTAMHVNA